MKLRLRNNVIPPITESIGRSWEQPDRSQVYVDDVNAYIAASEAKKLKRYDRSQPSGVYDGKMWVSARGTDDYLLWFEPTENPMCCATNYRKLVITNG